MESGRPAWEEEERASSEKKRWLLKRLDALCRAFEGQRGNYERIELLVGRVERLRGKNRRWKVTLLALAWTALWAAFLHNRVSQGDYPADALTVVFLLVVSLGPFVPIVGTKAARAKEAKRLESEATAVYMEIRRHYDAVPDNPLAIEYCDPDSLEAVRQIVASGRADTAKDAVNVLEESRCRSEMLHLQRNILEEARGARMAAESAARWAAAAASRHR